MRFISKFTQPTYEAIPITYGPPLATGRDNILEQGVTVRFRGNHHLEDWEYEAAKKVFYFNGLPTEEDERTFVEPRYRMGLYDTDLEAKAHRWSAEKKKQVEDFLLSDSTLGVEMIHVEQPRVPAPWPKYDELVVRGQRNMELVCKKIMETIDELGLDPKLVLTYEEQNGNRQEIVSALTALIHKDEEAVIEVAA